MSEEPEYGEHANDPDSVPRNQPNQGSNTLLGNRDYIIENRSWKDNFLLRDYLNLEQDAHWKIMIMQSMIQNKENWTEIMQVLREMTTYYTEIYKLNIILWYITKGDRELTQSLGTKLMN